MKTKMMMVLGGLLLLAQAGFAQTADTAASDDEAKRGAYSGAAIAKHPEWFKESFLDFTEDIAEATAAGKRLVL